MVFNDLCGLRKSESAISLKIPYNRPTITRHPVRIIYLHNELSAIDNAIEPLEGLYIILDVNQ